MLLSSLFLLFVTLSLSTTIAVILRYAFNNYVKFLIKNFAYDANGEFLKVVNNFIWLLIVLTYLLLNTFTVAGVIYSYSSEKENKNSLVK